MSDFGSPLTFITEELSEAPYMRETYDSVDEPRRSIRASIVASLLDISVASDNSIAGSRLRGRAWSEHPDMMRADRSA